MDFSMLDLMWRISLFMFKQMYFKEILSKLRGKYRKNTNVGKMCWFKTEAYANAFFMPKDLEDLTFFLRNKPKELRVYFMGAGSNLLISDAGFDGVVIRLGGAFADIFHNGEYIEAGAGCLDFSLAQYAVQHSIAGFEFFSTIPGTIGGALAMNAGCYGSQVSNVLIEAKCINIHNGAIKIFSHSEIGYFYRGKNLSNDWIFLSAQFKCEQGIKEDIAQKMDYFRKSREETQPLKVKTGGSTFKNPDHHLKAWEMLDACGLRGYRCGGAKFSEKHCNFIINDQNASASDIENLIQIATKKIKEKFQVDIQKEIKTLS